MRSVRCFVIISILFGMSALTGCGSKKTNKAEEFMKAGMYKQAIVMLEQEINDEPTNAKAHFLLGKCQLALGETGQAEESFACATRLNPNLGKDVGNAILELGRETIKAPTAKHGGRNKERHLLELAITYDPSLKREVAHLYLEQAKKLSDDDEMCDFLRQAVRYNENNRKAAAQILLTRIRGLGYRRGFQGLRFLIDLAVSYDPILKGEMAKIYLDQAKMTTDGNEVHRLLNQAVSYNGDSRQTAAQILLDRGNKHFKRREYRKGLNVFARAKEFDRNIDKDIKEKLFSVSASLPLNSVETFIEECRRIFPDLVDQVQKGILTNARNRLQQDKPALAVALLRNIIDTGNTSNQEVKSLLLKCSNELIEKNPDDFRKVMELLLKTYPEIIQSEDLMTKYLYGAHLWLSGSKKSGLTALRDVAKEVPLPCLDFVSKPIPKGKYAVSQSVELIPRSIFPEKLKIIVTITSIEVPPSDDSIIINLRVRNPSYEKKVFLFPRIKEEQKKALKKIEKVKGATVPTSWDLRGGSGSKRVWLKEAREVLATKSDFYLVDDLGNTLFPRPSRPYFSSSPKWKENFNYLQYNYIKLDSGQEISESLRFPILEPGSTSVRFTSPRHRDWLSYNQNALTFKPIVLRRVKFSKFPGDH